MDKAPATKDEHIGILLTRLGLLRAANRLLEARLIERDVELGKLRAKLKEEVNDD